MYFSSIEKVTDSHHELTPVTETLNCQEPLEFRHMTKKKKSNRIIECFGLEGTFKGHLVQPPCNEQGHLQLDEVVQSLVQPSPECFQGWGIYHLSGQPVPVFHHPHSEEFLPYVQSKSTLFQSKTATPYPVSTGPAKMFVPIFLLSPLLSTERPQYGLPAAFSSPG